MSDLYADAIGQSSQILATALIEKWKSQLDPELLGEIYETYHTEVQETLHDLIEELDQAIVEYLYGSADEQDARIGEILGEDATEVSSANLKKFFNYLKETVAIPCNVLGSEPFEWEKKYVGKSLSHALSDEYYQLKEDNPSFNDIYDMVRFVEYNESEGILVEVQRTDDDKVFILPLVYLEIADDDSPDFQRVNDYVYWFANY